MEVLITLCLLGTLFLGVQNSEIEISGFNFPALDDWWGPEELRDKSDTSIRPFKIEFEKKMIDDLLYRLKNHRPFTRPLEGAAFTYGFNTNQMPFWIDYWTNSYNFTAREAFLNQFPHFKTNVQGLDMHFIHVKPENCKLEVIPLMLLHGWPGSIREFYKAIPLLTECNEKLGFAVEVIVPSLPGFGFSDGAVRPGLGGTEMAVVLRNLMHKLGFEKFFIQGGDWGAHICNSIATLFPDEILGYHTNYAVSFAPASLATWFAGSLSDSLQSLVVEPSVANRSYPLSTIIRNLLTETGYLHLQATKPDTLGVGMSDSPSGLAAYILQIVSMASRNNYKERDDGGFLDLFTPDEMIDNLMIYWTPNSFTTAIRIYAETFNVRNVDMKSFAVATTTPVCTIHAADELIYQSPSILRHKYTNLLNSTILDTGGHFLALELPEVFSESVLSALSLFRKWHEDRKSNRGISCSELLKATPPVCTIHAADELVYQSPAMLRHMYPNLLNSTAINTRGHYLALEPPEIFSESALTFVYKRNFHAIRYNVQ